MSAASECKATATAEAEELREPRSVFEALHILRSRNPFYMAITNPTKDKTEALDFTINSLRVHIDQGVDEETGDETAVALAVALLWHDKKVCIEEGIQLMEYLLRERWAVRWSAVVGEGGVPLGKVVESGPDEEDDGDENWVNLETQEAKPGSYAAAWTASSRPTNSTPGSHEVLLGTAIQGATAPPPPEEEDGSIPPSLVRDRGTLPTAAHLASSSTTTTATTTTTTSSSYTSPGVGSSACATAAATLTRDEQLAQCYYHLAVGYTKLRMNKKALFYADHLLRLSPLNRDGLLLRRLLCARIYVTSTLTKSLPFLLLGLLFL
ncbi:hypothetical protein ABB37_04057 [Leptomonas pyrrhocoris]|uniref:Uncharacterized protein n=1 Tax=Leptomonas pyrrhocoris TaxID=157538 RepID=A0A0M9G3Z7_LEPPY|nr:hypothetical protein ABB37_04057 [Leptomonas pyrrhocoris]KPA81777.1 hypothetical protein ABB37_04057 [Leptomonas pyrrhocoris]|eukprot:XP_015660216.1 hypothetical protein ABB37_04057 [Leptomonas pyrrhocoris]